MYNKKSFKKNIKLFYLYSLSLLVIFIFSCKNQKEAFLFYNADYYYVYDEEYKIYKSIRKKLYRNFYQVNELSIDSFFTLPDIIKKELQNKRNAFFYINNFLTPLLLKDDLVSSNGNFKLLTYDLPLIETNNNNFSIFNIKVDALILKEKILNILKHYSNNKDFTDCGLIVNTNYSFPYDLISAIIEDNIKINILEIDTLDYDLITKWLNEKKINAVLLFGYEFNSFVLNLNKNEFKNISFFEFTTRYGEVSDKIKYNIEINWDLAIDCALESVEFNNFLKNKKDLIKIDYFVKNKNIIQIEKFKKIKN
jgi:hypothetical protein